MRSWSLVVALALLSVSLAPLMSVAGEQHYSGASISLDLNRADVHDVLRLLAEMGGINIIAGPGVQGRVTVHLVQVPWDQALAAILKLHGLAQERRGNVILVAPRSHFLAQRQHALRLRQAEQQNQPTVTRLVPVKYRRAAELQAVLAQQLGACATVSVDRRTNTLILTGTPSCLGRR